MSGRSSELILKSRLVRAGAGAGKTTGLVSQVAEIYREFVRHHASPRIVVTTFTRKATQELKERLIKKACDDGDAKFLEFVSDPGKLHISTIHGLLNVFLKQTGHLAGLDSGFTLLSEFEARQLARRALKDTITSHPNGLKWFELYGLERVLFMVREFDRLNREQDEPLVPATEADIERVAAPLLAAAQARMSEFAATILEENDNDEWVEFAHRLKEFAALWPATDIEALPKKPDKRSKVQKALSAWHDRAEEILGDIKQEFSRPAWQQSHWPAMARLWQDFDSFARGFSHQFNQEKERQGRFEMNDLELLTARLLREKPFLAEVFGDNWDYWMVDEYQDTSPLQARCLKALIGDKPKYVVGDPQQSIYLFRGADVTVFAREQEVMREGQGEVHELMRNYRSRPALLHFINEFMNSVDRVFAPMQTGEDVGAHEPVAELVRGTDDADELRALVARVGELVARGVDLKEICILGRAHHHLSEAAAALRLAGYPTHLHASSGFYERREVLDAQALWMFLLNPHDSENLITLLRSPWFYVPDSQLEAWMRKKPSSLWRLLQSEPDIEAEAVARLEEARETLKSLGVIKTFEKILSEAGYLDFCLRNDPAGRKESNLWKLIDKARALESESTRSLLDLSSGDVVIDPLEANEGDATSAQEPNCINLMTVHAAKGLEFEHVLIPRMGKSLPPIRCADFSADEGKFFFPLKDEEGENAPSILDLRGARGRRALEDAEFNRSLYVAATRAKSSLTFLFGKIERDSWAARSAWFNLPAGLHEDGRFTFQVREARDLVDSPPVALHGDAKAGLVRAPWSAPLVDARVNKQSVTGLLHQPKQSARSGALMRFEARNKGQRIHRQLESLKYGRSLDTQGDPAVDFVLQLQDPPMREIIQNGETEWGFQVQTAAGVIEGQIDVWGKVGGEIFVVDYKSGSPTQVEDAFKQLASYAWALRRFGHREKMWLVVIYPLQQIVERRPFTEELFLRREQELSLPQTAGQDDLTVTLLDGGHRHIEGDHIARAKPVHVRE